MDKFLITAFWILSLFGAAMYGHEFGMISGAEYQKKINSDQLMNCNRIIAGSLYE